MIKAEIPLNEDGEKTLLLQVIDKRINKNRNTGEVLAFNITFLTADGSQKIMIDIDTKSANKYHSVDIGELVTAKIVHKERPDLSVREHFLQYYPDLNAARGNIENDYLIELFPYYKFSEGKPAFFTLEDALKYDNPTEVEVLSLSLLEEFPKEVSNFPNLKYLEFNACQFKKIPKLDFQKLETFLCVNGFLSSIPSALYKINSLAHIDLTNNSITEIDKKIVSLENLEHLSLDKNLISKIAEEIAQMNKLKYLSLSSNRLIKVTEQIYELKDLTYLNLGINRVSEIPESISNLQNLKDLNLNNNKLITLPEAINSLPSLEILDIHSNELSNISLAGFNSLKKLNLSKNKFLKLSRDLSNLSQLQELNVSYNELSELPENYGNMKLTKLDARDNQIGFLPEQVFNMTSLNELVICNNPIEEGLEEIKNLTNLRKLYLPKNFDQEKIQMIKQTLAQTDIFAW